MNTMVLRQTLTQKFILFSICLTVTFAGFAFAEDANKAGGTPLQAADQFEQFISNPPPIEDLCMSSQFINQPTSYYHIKWQSDCNFIGFEPNGTASDAINATNLTDFDYIYSKFNEIYWQKVTHDLYCWTNLYLPAQASNSVTFANHNYLRTIVYPILNGGIDVTPPGTIRWNGDTCLVTNIEGVFWHKGLITRDKAGRAASLQFWAARIGDKEATNALSVWSYFYDRQLSLPYLPSRIEWRYTNAQNHLLERTFEIYSVKVAAEPMSEAAYSLNPLLGTTNTTTLITVVSNQLVITPKKLNNTSESTVIQDGIAPPIVHHTNFRRIYFFIAVTLLCLPIVTFFLARKSKNDSNKNT